MSQTFGKFSLIERIGGGRLSQVFRVDRSWRSTASEPNIVLKRVAPELISERAFVQLVAREAGVLSRLSHKNLCVCQEMGVIDGCAFLTLEQVDGCTLRALLRRLSQMRISLPTSAVLAVAYQAAQVLDYLHRQSSTPLAHLDLSPQNVMLTRDGTLQLIDFGIARFLDGHDPPPLGGRIAGTVGYMSPEQARGEKEITAAADQYALGILLWEMLAGRRLFAGNTNETWRRMRTGDVPDLSQLTNGGSSGCVQIVMRLLAAEPADRFANMGELITQIELLSPSPLSGAKPLAALTNRLMNEADFDPFDAVRTRDNTDETPLPVNIPTGEVRLDEYAELEIAVDHGEGTPSAQMRAVVPLGSDPAPPPRERTLPRLVVNRAPESPFLEPSDSFDQEVVASRR